MKVDRLVSMILVLLEKERVGAQELADMFEVSPRTIYRDIDAINMAGVPVRGVPGAGGGFEIMRGYKIDNKVFSAADLSALLTALSGLFSMVGGSELATVLAKVKSFIPADRADDILKKAGQICIDPAPWTADRAVHPCLETVRTALRESRLLQFGYMAHRGVKTRRMVEPYQLVLKNSQWYLQGYCRTKNDFRLFKLSRTFDMQLQQTSFAPRDQQRPVLDFTDILKSIQIEIELRIHRSIADIVLTYCPYEHFSPDDDTHYLVRFPFVENEYHYNLLFHFGDKCECLGPPHVRAEVKRRAQRIAAIYGGSQ